MLVIADYNTKTGEKIELKDLEKYGFKWVYQISKDGEIPHKKKYMRYEHIFYIMKENKTYNVRDKAVEVKSKSFDSMSLLYDFIEKGLIINVKEEEDENKN